MKIKILESTENSVKLLMEDTSPSVVNAIRRAMLVDVPKMAIDDVEFHLGPIRGAEEKEFESITPLFDENIAHRLGLLPIPTDLSNFVRKEECKTCKGEGCPSCTMIYSLNKQGPCTVYSKDLEPVGGKEFKIVDENIPLVKLGPGQALLVYATAVMGTGREHAKWQSVNSIGYKYYPNIEIDSKKCDIGGSCVHSCPKNILKIENKKLVVQNVEDCTLCMSCVEVCEANCIKVHGDSSKILMKFETDGSIEPEQILNHAIKNLGEMFEDLKKKIDELK
jgi:DNA-directed RNA polymerase subunit D